MGLAAVAFVASSAFAQATSFAGTWNMVQDPAQQQAAGGGNGGRGGGFGGFGPTFTITQDAKTLTITRTTQNGESKQVYNLDGSDSKNTMPGRGGNPGMEQISNAKWEGSNLVITTKIAMGEQTFEQKRTISLAADGTLTIETASTQPGRDGQPRPAQKVQYKKG
jgi:hypothetical protein